MTIASTQNQSIEFNIEKAAAVVSLVNQGIDFNEAIILVKEAAQPSKEKLEELIRKSSYDAPGNSTKKQLLDIKKRVDDRKALYGDALNVSGIHSIKSL